MTYSLNMSTSPILTRSSSSSGPTTSVPAISVKQPTNNDIMKAINGLKKSQSEVITSVANITKSQNSQFAELKKDFQIMSNILHALQADNTSLRGELSTLKDRVVLLESKSNVLGSVSAPSLIPDMIHEFAEREKCSLNLIVHNLTESSSTISSERIASDTKNLIDILSPISISLPPNFKIIRLGRSQSNNPRPLKIFLNNKEEVLNILSLFNTTKRTCPSVTISISRDRTLMERNLVRQIYAEFKDRTDKGESNIRIRYSNGIPHIVNHGHDVNKPSTSKN